VTNIKELMGRWRRHGRRAQADALGRGLATLYARAPLGVATFTAEGRFRTANDALLSLLGYSERELLARTLDDVTHPEDVAACRELFGRVRRGEQDHFAMEKRFLRKDGAVVWARVIVAAVPGESGAPIETIGAAVDITERKRAEADYRSLYDRTPAMMHSIDREGRIISVSERWLETLGYRREEVLGRRSVEFLDAESRHRALTEVLPRFYREGAVRDVPYRYVAKDGRPVDVLLSATCERDEKGEVRRSLAVLADVTERLRAEEEVRRLNAELEERVAQRTALLEAVQESSPDGILVVDPVGRIVSYNPRFARMWRIAPEVLATGSDDAALKSVLDQLADPESFAAGVAALYEDRQARSFDEVHLRDGRVFERFSAPISGPGGRHYGRIWYFRDVTRRVERERLLRDKSLELERSNADLEMYAFAASHDLSAPMRKISLLGAVLERRAGGKLDEEERRMLGRMRAAADGLGSLVKEMLAMSLIGREHHPPEVVDLGAVIAEVLEDMKPGLERAGARVSVGPLPRLRAHRSLLYRLIQNLIANALKFHRSEEPSRVRIESRTVDGGVEVLVKDNGIGFEPRFAKMIFEPFSRLHAPSAYGGHGIGLAVCQRVCSRYGGRIAAEGAPGVGATFVVWLPESMVAR
jgi:PAS domain S-box-containing protein